MPLSLPVQNAQALFAYAALKPDQLHARAKIITLRWQALAAALPLCRGSPDCTEPAPGEDGAFQITELAG